MGLLIEGIHLLVEKTLERQGVCKGRGCQGFRVRK